jgi:hypothetical protein
MEGLINGLYQTYHRLTRMYAREFIPRLRDAVWTALTECSDAFIRRLNRDHVQNILFGLGCLLKRYYSID